MANLRLVGFFGLVVTASGALLVPLLGSCTSGQGSSGQGASGQGGGAECEGLPANEYGPPIPVRFINQTGADLYLQLTGGTCGAHPFRISGPNGEVLEWGGASSSCSYTCEDVSCVCTTTCSPVPVTRITPGGTATMEWHGDVREKRKVSASCAKLKTGYCVTNGSCEVDVLAKEFPLTFAGVAYTELSCDGGECTCAPDANGICKLGGITSPAGEAVVAKAVFDEGGTAIDLVFTAP
jgi:hypothetical protein